jgi:predicted dehydrogenase
MVKIVLVGIGGYGQNYVSALLDNSTDINFEIAGVVDPFAENCLRLNELIESGVKVFSSLDDFYNECSADLAVVSSPIHLHYQQTKKCLDHGTNVLCEKPLAGSLDDGKAMSDDEKASEQFVAIGYQWSFSAVMQSLKNDIINGMYGKPQRLKTFVAWSRRKSYYSRNSWAGRIRLDDGEWVLDSPAQNATAHYLHNMFYILGDNRESSAYPAKIEADTFRANDIENYDTIGLRVKTESGVDILFYSTHAVRGNIGPIIEYKFDKGVVKFDDDGVITGYLEDGSIKKYGDPNINLMDKLWHCIEAVEGGGKVACGIEAALPQLICIQNIYESCPETVDFSHDMMVIDEGTGALAGDLLVWVSGLYEELFRCYENNLIPSECNDFMNSRKNY